MCKIGIFPFPVGIGIQFIIKLAKKASLYLQAAGHGGQDYIC